jgi:hypothetical protein
MMRAHAPRALLLAAALSGAAAAPAQDLREEMLNQEFEAPKNPLRLDGTVTGPNGPASNVTVLLEVTDMRIRRQVDYQRTRTNADGAFSFDLSRYDIPHFGLQVNTLSPRFMEAMRIVKPRREELPVTLDLRVEPGAAVEGIVVDEKGDPVKNAFVDNPGRRSARSGEDGRFEIFGVPPEGETTLRIFREGYLEVFLPIRPQGPELIRDQRVVLRPASSISGTVTDPNGAPIAGAVVVFRTQEAFQRQLTDSRGTFRFIGTPKDPKGAIIEMSAQDWLPYRGVVGDDIPVSDTITLQARPAVVLAGKIRTPKGTPASNARLVLGDGRRSERIEVKADGAGNWRYGPVDIGVSLKGLVLPAPDEGTRAFADLHVTGEAAPGRFRATVDPWSTGPRSEVEVEVRADSPIVRMTRRDSGEGAYPGTVTYTGEFDGKRETMSGRVLIEATGAEGRFTARRAPDSRPSPLGRWDIQEELGPGRDMGAPREVQLSSGLVPGTRLADLTLADELVLSGVVRSSDGKPVTRGTVVLLEWEGRTEYRRSTPIGAGGEFRLPGLPAGLLRIAAADEAGGGIVPPTYARGGVSGFVLSEEPADPMDMPPGS